MSSDDAAAPPETPGRRLDPTTLSKGDVIGEATYRLDRETLVRYAGASGDFNPIHYNDEFARSVGLDGVIAHGMLTMGTAVDLVARWVGDPGAISGYAARFSKPVPVPNPGFAALDVKGVVGAIDLSAGTVRIDLTCMLGEVKVLSRVQVMLGPLRIG